MAEALLRDLAGDRYDIYSAATRPSQVNPLAIKVMAERGVDISRNRSKHMNEFLNHPFDFVITVCDEAAEACPIFPGRAERIHWSFTDPAAAMGTESQR